jgi:hypothetical protein
MRVFSGRLRWSFHPWAEARPFKGPRSRWTEIPRIQNTDNSHLIRSMVLSPLERHSNDGA